jgi:putative component of membrane protein insertase Oxa1/YidC/SpoIIIJ protein YidD
VVWYACNGVAVPAVSRAPLNKALEFTYMLRGAAIFLIVAYQRFISPHKGYSCAYRVHTGRASCSAFGKRAISRLGVQRGILALRYRFRACSKAALAMAASGEPDPKTPQSQSRSCSKREAAEGGVCCVTACPW